MRPFQIAVFSFLIAWQSSLAMDPIGTKESAPVSSAGSDSVKASFAITPPLMSKFSLRRLPNVAVLSFTGDGIQARDLAAVTNRFEIELLASDSFKIIERRNIDRILREQGFQQSGACDNSECSVELGKLLSVDGIYTGEVGKVGKTWTLSVKRTDVGTGQTIFSHVMDIDGGLEDVLRGGCPEMALIASGRKKPQNSRTVLVPQGSAIWPWIAGGTLAVGAATAATILWIQNGSSNSTPTRNVAVTW